ncbi:MAG: DUF4974 domain-containing protein [Bacteroidetes bacterium]|nr:MAG: DUF4974 domain-containing protein [Bacteroidota bacterium]
MSTRIPKDDFLAHWLVGQAEATDDQAWENREQEDQLRRVVEAAAQLNVPATRSREAAWAALQSRIEAESSPVPVAKVRSFPRLSSLMRVAAAIALLFVAGLLVQRWLGDDAALSAETISKATPAQSSPLTLTLPDASEVVLNDLSAIHYEAASWADGHRSLRLEGEAFFRVKPGSTFSVETELGTVTVRGTSFNVFTRKEKMEVICFSGEVAVSLNGSSEAAYVLTPGEAVRYETGGRPQRYQAEVSAGTPGWSEGIFAFREAPLEQVLEEMERQYEVQLELDPSAADGHFTGTFYVEDAFTTTLANFCKAMGLEAQPLEAGSFKLIPAGHSP